PVLILDEPTTGLDPNQIVEIRQLIKDLGKEKTIIFSTHILSEVEATCDRMLIINKGKIVADGTPETLKKLHKKPEILRLKIEDGNAMDVLLGLNQLESVETAFLKDDKIEVISKPELSSKRSIFNLCVSNQWILTEITSVDTNLEEVFHELTINS
ncbi:MAG: gliding motility-associated ABC transporter ATP-binding subunit GldA, partial [Bacteroidota bacterium]|nr:gliding motility-associated ABC transporter ATP-binding subunit GldA [Bacteroidota bacterium]